MKLYWHTQNNNSRLALVFNGWGFDGHILSAVDALPGTDILLVYDYTTIEPQQLACVQRYAQVDLVAWSFGVFAANCCAEVLPVLNQCIAVNGTLQPVDDRYGIPRQIFQSTLQTYDEHNRKRFQMRLAGSASAYKAMQEQLPQRDVQNQLEELKALGQFFLTPPACRLNWTKAIVSNADKIFPPENMKAAWGELACVLDGEHHVDFARILHELL